MKEYVKPIIEEEIIENDDIIMASSQTKSDVDAMKGINVSDLLPGD
jgi:hypothetical protein